MSEVDGVMVRCPECDSMTGVSPCRCGYVFEMPSDQIVSICNAISEEDCAEVKKVAGRKKVKQDV
jgi:hypothetical protein